MTTTSLTSAAALAPTSTHQTAQAALGRVAARAWCQSLDDAAGDATKASVAIVRRVQHDRRLAAALVQCELLALAGDALAAEGMRALLDDAGDVRWVTRAPATS